MTKLYSVHGFADANGKHTTDRLHPFFAAKGFECEAFDYGFHFLVSPRNSRWARELTERVQPGSIGIGFSNGCLILQKASFLGAPFEQLVFINPALDADAEVGPQIKACHVWYSKWDLGLRIAKLFPWSQWGSMGATGPTGPWPPFIGYNKGEAPFTTRSFTHLDFFLPDTLDYFGPLLVERVEELRETHKEEISK